MWLEREILLAYTYILSSSSFCVPNIANFRYEPDVANCNTERKKSFPFLFCAWNETWTISYLPQEAEAA